MSYPSSTLYKPNLFTPSTNESDEHHDVDSPSDGLRLGLGVSLSSLSTSTTIPVVGDKRKRRMIMVDADGLCTYFL